MGYKGNISEFEWNMTAGTRWASMSISQIVDVLRFARISISGIYSDWSKKKKRSTVSNSSLSAWHFWRWSIWTTAEDHTWCLSSHRKGKWACSKGQYLHALSIQQPNVTRHNAWIISGWFPEHDNKLIVLKWSPQSPVPSPVEQPRYGWTGDLNYECAADKFAEMTPPWQLAVDLWPDKLIM